jgi:hypothetical protein
MKSADLTCGQVKARGSVRRCIGEVRMTSNDLDPDACGIVAEKVAGHLLYLNRLVARLAELGIPPEDPLRRDAERAVAALAAFRMTAHYLSLRSTMRGGGYPPPAGPAGGQVGGGPAEGAAKGRSEDPGCADVTP